MKSGIITGLSFALLFASLGAYFAVAAEADDPPSGNITVIVKALRNSDGVERVALFGSKETYNNDHNVGMGAFRKVVVPISGDRACATFSEIPYGDYAVKVFHDENNSGKFVTNAFGFARVEHAVSNNARARFGDPSYEKARFFLNQPNLTLEIETAAK